MPIFLNRYDVISSAFFFSASINKVKSYKEKDKSSWKNFLNFWYGNDLFCGTGWLSRAINPVAKDESPRRKDHIPRYSKEISVTKQEVNVLLTDNASNSVSRVTFEVVKGWYTD